MDAHTLTKQEEHFKQTLSACQKAVFWDRKGVLMVEFMQQGTTITLDMYCKH
jgi:hypothetical protein